MSTRKRVRRRPTELSAEGSKAGRLQRACLALVREHERDGALPTSIRFLFYELVQRGVVSKQATGARRPDQDVSSALKVLRDIGLVPWDWIVDETRSLSQWRTAPSVAEYLADSVPLARVDRWAGQPAPLVLCESRSLAGVLDDLAADYAVPIAATNGQAGGFLVTKVAPLVVPGQRVLYLGDHDWSGTQIEANTRRTVDEHAAVPVQHWERVALTAEQVEAYQLPVIMKTDGRDKESRPAVETEALSQSIIVDIVRDRLDELMPEPLADVRVREAEQRARVVELLREAL